jgi:adenine deaminase
MLCSDDMHPDSLVVGHINLLVRRALQHGYELFDVLRAACVHPVEHYGLDVGLLREGDPADCIITAADDPSTVYATFVRGQCVAMNGSSHIARRDVPVINRFSCEMISERDIAVDTEGKPLRVIQAHDGQLVTTEVVATEADDDVLKIVVVNRYQQAQPSIGFIRGIGLRSGALASSVAHDSHNIVAVGADDASILASVNAVIAAKGGISVCDGANTHVLPLPVAGLMSANDGYDVARRYAVLDARAKELGSTLRAPFMTLSFMALLVIPELKMSDKGLFDGR